MSDTVNENQQREVCEAPDNLKPSLEEQMCFAKEPGNQSQGKSGITGEFQQPFVLVDSVREREEEIFGAKGWLNDDEDSVYAALKDITVQERQDLERVFTKDHGMTVNEYLQTFMNDDEMAKAQQLIDRAPVNTMINTWHEHDRQIRDEAKALNDLASDQEQRKLCDPEGSARTDRAVEQLAKHLVEFTASRSISDNHGWAETWENALRALTVEDTIEVARKLGDTFNEQAQKAGVSSRVQVEVEWGEAGTATLEIRRENPGLPEPILRYELPRFWPDGSD